MMETELCKLFKVPAYMQHLIESIDEIDDELKGNKEISEARMIYLLSRKETLLELRDLYAGLARENKNKE